MAEDNEFLSRKERDERIKNIEYQVEEEQAIFTEKQHKEKARRERNRKKEVKKEQAQIEQAEKQRAVAEAEQEKKKIGQQDARAIMEQKRKIKNQNTEKSRRKVVNEKTEVTKDSTSAQINPSAITVSASNLAKENVSTELYVDGKKVSEKVLPEDLVKKIRREQQKAIRQTEGEIKEAEEAEKKASFSNVNGTSQTGTKLPNGRLANSSQRYGSTSSRISSQSTGGNTKGRFINNLNHGVIPGLGVKESGPMSVANGKYRVSTGGRRGSSNSRGSNGGKDGSSSTNNGASSENFADKLGRNC